MEAIGKYIVVKPIDQEQEMLYSSGLLVAASDASKMRYKEAVVISSGSEVYDKIAKDCKISYDSVQGHDIKVGDDIFRVISEKDVILLL
jgi:co-chaperonin GroES (HSP10)